MHVKILLTVGLACLVVPPPASCASHLIKEEQNINVLLKSVNTIEGGNYKLHSARVQITTVLPTFIWFHAVRNLRHAMGVVVENVHFKQLPENMRKTITSELAHKHHELNILTENLDLMLVHAWEWHFDQMVDMDYSEGKLDESISPALFNRSIDIQVHEYRMPTLFIEKIVSMEVKYMLELAFAVKNRVFLNWTFLIRNRIINVLRNRHLSLQKVCAAEGAELNAHMYLIPSGRETMEEIFRNLIWSLSLQKHGNHFGCLMGYVTYLSLVEKDLSAIMSHTLVKPSSALSFLVPNTDALFLLGPLEDDLTPREREEKLGKVFQKTRGERNIFLDMLGGASEQERLANSLEINGLTSAMKDLHASQMVITNDYSYVMKTRKINEDILSNIRDQLKGLGAQSEHIDRQVINNTRRLTSVQQQLSGVSASLLSLEMISEELGILKKSINDNKEFLNKIVYDNFIMFDRVALILDPHSREGPEINVNEKGIVIVSKTSTMVNQFTKIIFETIPLKKEGHIHRMKLPAYIITNGRYKIKNSELHLCDDGTRVCDPHAVLVKLSPCEQYLLGKTTFSSQVGTSCWKGLRPTSSEDIEFIRVGDKLLIFSTIVSTGRLFCPLTSNTVAILPGTLTVPLADDCWLELQDFIISGRTTESNISYSYDSFESDLDASIQNLIDIYNASETVNEYNYNRTFNISGLEGLLNEYQRVLHAAPELATEDKSFWDSLHPDNVIRTGNGLSGILAITVGVLVLIIAGMCYKLFAHKCRSNPVPVPQPYPEMIQATDEKKHGRDLDADLHFTLPLKMPLINSYSAFPRGRGPRPSLASGRHSVANLRTDVLEQEMLSLSELINKSLPAERGTTPSTPQDAEGTTSSKKPTLELMGVEDALLCCDGITDGAAQ